MCIWELGEHAAFIAAPLAWLLKPLWKCRCEARRTWLNAIGERWWARWFPILHHRQLSAWSATVSRILDAKVASVAELRGCYPLQVSENTATRWLGELVKSGQVAKITISGQTLYGLPLSADTVSESG